MVSVAGPQLRAEPFFVAAGATTATNLVQLAKLVGTTRNTLMRWRRLDAIPIYSADRACAALNVHPMCIWGDDWLEADT